MVSEHQTASSTYLGTPPQLSLAQVLEYLQCQLIGQLHIEKRNLIDFILERKKENIICESALTHSLTAEIAMVWRRNGVSSEPPQLHENIRSSSASPPFHGPSKGRERQDTSSSKIVWLKCQKDPINNHVEDICPLLISLVRFQSHTMEKWINILNKIEWR